MPAQLHIPVIGSGSIGHRHYGNLTTLGVSSELLSFRATGLSGVEALLKRGKADGIVIATATDIRVELIEMCAGFKVPMYIEKPLAVTRAQVEQLYAACPLSLQQQCVAGYMMRYHPLLNKLQSTLPGDIYRFDMIIGHDVNQWRSNWRFSQSYAAREQGGGVLLDLCHELDMAQMLFPDIAISQVSCLGHKNFAGVDFSTQISVLDNHRHGTVSMDYLSPVSTRLATFYGLGSVTHLDFNALTCRVENTAGSHTDTLTFERNDMFTHAMKDFMALLEGGAVSAHCPRLDVVRGSADLVATAWEARRFNAYLDQPVS